MHEGERLGGKNEVYWGLSFIQARLLWGAGALLGASVVPKNSGEGHLIPWPHNSAALALDFTSNESRYFA
jgi:hypothetical protein